jgi:hypothetical protein
MREIVGAALHFFLLIAVTGKKSWNDQKAETTEKPKRPKSWND